MRLFHRLSFQIGIVFSAQLHAVDGDFVTRYQEARRLLSEAKMEKAVERLEQLKSEESDFRKYVLFDLASSYKKLGKMEEQKGCLQELLKLNLTDRMQIEVTIELSELVREEKEKKEIYQDLRRIERKARSLDSYPEVILGLIRYSDHGEKKGWACKGAGILYSRYPLHPKIQNWGPRLNENSLFGREMPCEEKLSLFQKRIKSLAVLGEDARALKEIEDFFSKNQKNAINVAEKSRTLAIVYKQREDLALAARELEQHFKSQKKDPKYLLEMAHLYTRLGDLDRSAALFQMVQKLGPGSREGRNALFYEALLYYQSQNYDGAMQKFQLFRKRFPREKQALDCQWYLGWITYLKGDYQGAEKVFRDLMRERKYLKVKSLSREKIQYWLAMTLLRQGKAQEARDLFYLLGNTNGFGFYHLAAQSRRNQIRLTPDPAKSGGTKGKLVSNGESFDESRADSSLEVSDEDQEEESFSDEISTDAEAESNEPGANSEADQTLEAGRGEPEDENLGLLKSKFNGQFERARQLMDLGLKDWAKDELFQIEKKTRNREFLRTLMFQYEKTGEYYRPFYLAQITFAKQRIGNGIDGARYLWEFAYPKAYPDLVSTQSEKQGVPKELIWSIMRAESNYRPYVISPVGARGLMQVMPFTGLKVSEMMGLSNYEPNRLFDPLVAISIGARYLKRLSDHFFQSTPLIAGAYNAGPHRMRNWISQFGQLDADEFIEHIPFLETRNYIKKVLANEFLYQKLYVGGKKPLQFLATNLLGEQKNNLEWEKANEHQTRESWE